MGLESSSTILNFGFLKLSTSSFEFCPSFILSVSPESHSKIRDLVKTSFNNYEKDQSWTSLRFCVVIFLSGNQNDTSNDPLQGVQLRSALTVFVTLQFFMLLIN